MAWIVAHKTKAGRTVYHVHWRDAEGKHRSKSTKSGRRDTAELLMAQIQKATEAGAPPTPKGPDELLAGFLAAGRVSRTEATIDKQKRQLAPLLKVWKAKGLKVEAWSAEELGRYIAERRDKKRPRPWGYWQTAMFLQTCRAFMKWCRNRDDLFPDFVGDLRPPQRGRKIVQAYEPGELAALLSEARGHPLEVPIALGALAGMRPSEWRNIEARDLDWQKKQLLIRSPKTEDDRRVPMLPALVEILARNKVASGPLVRLPYHHSGAYYSALRNLCREAGVPYLSFHKLRSTFASIMVSKGASIRAVQALLGHRNLATTSVYLRENEDDKVRAVDLLARAVGQV